MPFSKDENEETKKRIIEVAEHQFADKGFDAARVDDIAQDAGVNKALIYYYFKSKEDILNHLIKTFFTQVTAITVEFVKENVISMIKKEKLDIQQNRWCFSSEGDARNFYDALMGYYEKVVDFTISHRRIARIIVFESLKNGKHHNALFRLQDLLYQRKESSLYQTIWETDKEFTYSSDQRVFDSFFGLVPIFNFAAYFEDYMAASKMNETELRESFLRAYQKMSLVFIDGKNIML